MEFNLDRPSPGSYVHYHITSANRTAIGSHMMQFVQHKLVKLRALERNETELVLEYTLVAQQMEGTVRIHDWAADMDELQSPLELVLDNNGRLKDIRNFSTLHQKWTGFFAARMQKKYKHLKESADNMIAETDKLLKDKARFLRAFEGYSAWRFFFQDNYAEKKPLVRAPFVLKTYFGAIDLPLLMESRWKEEYELHRHRYSLENRALLDAARFDRKSFARMLKDLTGVFNINASLEADLEEHYEYNGEHWLTKAELFLETKVSDWYSIVAAHTLAQVPENEALQPEKLFQAEAAA
ncbi:hypothetical protein ACFOTA_16505 [Chitinophaga sp. GCM10012297]|uniref:Uncharacterized protein n=1 Tax=Chitinophaga chungangae TaxID=2821488 RepID=A0ABS3YGL0_9BACT|nr:hypothetical protein [Chitinophaga chungangae]MBO9153823.1 hypothetical protein [Chitinophaga chungangae]